MKILYIDFLSPVGHKNYNFSLLDNFLELNIKIDAVFKKGYLNEYKNKNHLNKTINIPSKFFPSNNCFNDGLLYKIFYRFNLYREMKWINNIITENDYDLIFFSSIEIISFCLNSYNINTRCVFVDHAIGEIDRNKTKRFFWKNINSKIEPIVMEDYIKQYLKDDLKVKNKIWILPHPLPSIDPMETKEEEIIFGPSGSNDEKFISFLINNCSLIKKYKIIMKSNETEYESNNLLIYNKRISQEKYYDLMSKSKIIILPYKNNYNYRVSGVFFEAVKFKKHILIHKNNTLEYYKTKFPRIVSVFSDFDNFFELLNEIDLRNQNEDFNKALKTHSKINIRNKLKNILYNRRKSI
jgi:hypothetical protein